MTKKKKKVADVRLFVRLPSGLKAKVARFANAQKVSVAEVVRQAVQGIVN